MKKPYILIAAALLATGAAAQNPSAYFMEGSTFRSQFNPAFAPLRGYVNIPVLGGVQVNMAGNIALDNILYPRDGKRGGAWCGTFREASYGTDGKRIAPIVTIVCNFTRPNGSDPAQLTLDETETLFHEFGHALHKLFSQVRYAGLNRVERDFVELPSQLMENWATEKEFLDLWAVHYETGEPMPAEIVDRIVAAQNYLAAYANVRQLSFGMTDMAWHTLTEPFEGDVEQFEAVSMAPTQVLPVVPGTAMAPAFGHIFSGGYAAGYYGYKWAEVLEADAFSLFKEKGIFNREAASSFRENVLAKGGTEHPMELYVRFRGHKPETRALIEKMGLGK